MHLQQSKKKAHGIGRYISLATISFFTALTLFVSVPGAFAVDRVTLSPGADIQFTSLSDAITLYVQVSPAEAGVMVFVETDNNFVNISQNPLTTDKNGTASFILTPGSSQGMNFLSVTAAGVTSEAIIVTNRAVERRFTIDPPEIFMNINKSVQSRATITLSPAEIANVTITNSNPEVISVVSTLSTQANGSADMIITALGTGVARIKATLAGYDMESNELLVKVFGDEKMVPKEAQVFMKVNESREFSVLGGSGTFSWSASDGLISEQNNDKATWTAPSYPGVFTLHISDTNGRSTQIRVVVASELELTPREVWVMPGEMVQFLASGGDPFPAWDEPYKFTCSNSGSTPGPVPDTPEYAIFTAPEGITAPDDPYLVHVKDSRDNTAVARVHVLGKMSLSTDTVRITRDIEIDTSNPDHSRLTELEWVEISNGRAPFSITIKNGAARYILDNRTIYLVPPHENGSSIMFVRDAMGSVEEVSITTEIPGRLQISPLNPEAELESHVTLTASGGKPPYNFISSAGAMAIQPDGSAQLHATGTSSDITVMVKDSAGASSTAVVKVIQPIRVEPAADETVKLFTGESAQYHISGGSGHYHYSVDKGTHENSVQINNDGTFIFTAPMFQGTIVLTITDTRGSTPVRIPFDISRHPLTVSPTIVYTDINSLGLPFKNIKTDYDFNITTKLGRVERTGNAFIYKPPVVTGTDTISLSTIPAPDSDEKIYPLDITVHITSGLIISPLQLFLENSPSGSGLTGTFTVAGGLPPYTLTSLYGTLSSTFLTQPGQTVTYTAPNMALDNEQITVVDSKGTRYSAGVHIRNQLRVTPLEASLTLYTEPYYIDFRILNGMGGYAPVVSDGDMEPIGNALYRYTPPMVAGQYDLTFTDASGDQTLATVYVGTSLKTTPSISYLRPGESTDIKVMAGTPPYDITCTMGYLSETRLESSHGSVTYTAPHTTDGSGDAEIYLKIHDSMDEVVISRIVLDNRPKPVVYPSNNYFRADDDAMDIKMNILGTGTADVYIALFHPNGLYCLFDENGSPVLDLLPYKRSVDPSEGNNGVISLNLKSLLPAEFLTKGEFQIYGALTPPGKPLAELPVEEWYGGLAFDTFTIR
ncbi:MAG: hypothetical protein HQK66_01900 [Desulfamplus sp.]|nr:hypothetical protein [Desulfamplus sp.]